MLDYQQHENHITENDYMKCLVDACLLIDDVEPDEPIYWASIWGDVSIDGYPSFRDASLIESLIRHLFC